MFREKIRFFNPEWFREPASKLESTLRTPYVLRHAGNLFLSRFGFKWFLSVLFISLIINNVFVSIVFGFVLTLVLELLSLKEYYETKALPKHLRNVQLIKKFSSEAKSASTQKLVENIDNSVRIGSWGLVNITYVGLAAWGWEIVFRAAYPLITNSKILYQNLLVGFGNKVTESDQLLWEVSQEKNKAKKQDKLNMYLEEFGSKVDDLEISRPTLREQPKVVNKLLELYSQTDSPDKLLKEQQAKREVYMQSVMDSLRIPRSSFVWIVKRVQENVALREDRRYYQFISDYYIREMIKILEKKLTLDKGQIFSTSWKNIKRKVAKITK